MSTKVKTEDSSIDEAIRKIHSIQLEFEPESQLKEEVLELRQNRLQLSKNLTDLGLKFDNIHITKANIRYLEFTENDAVPFHSSRDCRALRGVRHEHIERFQSNDDMTQIYPCHVCYPIDPDLAELYQKVTSINIQPLCIKQEYGYLSASGRTRYRPNSRIVYHTLEDCFTLKNSKVSRVKCDKLYGYVICKCCLQGH